jgi:hypothetical protein
MENKKIEFSELSKMNSHQLVNLYNKYVDTEVFSPTLMKFYWHILSELRKRKIDCSRIARGNSIFYGPAFRCFLHRNKIYLQRDYSPQAGITLHFKDGRRWEFSVRTVFVDQPHVSIGDIYGNEVILLIIRHDHLQTHIDATGLKHHLIGGFDHRGDFTSMTMLNSNADGRYALLSQARTALVLRDGWELLKWDHIEFYEEKNPNLTKN